MKKIWLVIFLLVAGIYTATINTWNGKYFGLQAATVAALTERGTFALIDEAIPGFTLAEGDETFRHNGKIYPMKQPGQTVIGMLAYAPLMMVGYYFLNHYEMTVQLITMATSVFMTAAAAVVIYELCRMFVKNEKTALLTTGTFAFGSIMWPYSGVLHHDVYAAFFSLGGIAAYFYYLYGKRKTALIYLSGFLLSGMLFFSMLPVTIPIVIGLLILTRKNKNEILAYAGGVLTGLIPSFIFNYTQFGSILAFPNLAGKVADTVPMWDPKNFGYHLYYYLLSPVYSLTAYMPVLWFAVLGILKMPIQYREAKKVLIFVPLALLVHICTQETYGGYQYGPRYLLPILPILTLGIPFFLAQIKNRTMKIIFGIAFAYSVATAAIGSVQTVMFPASTEPVFHPNQFGPADSLLQIKNGNMPVFKLKWPGAMMAGLAIFFAIFPDRLLRRLRT